MGGTRGGYLIREAPVVAVFILMGVCLTGLGLVLRDPFALVAVAPLAAVLGAYFRRVKSY